jgi:hypothetical protein
MHSLVRVPTLGAALAGPRALGGIPPETLAAIMGEIELLRNLHHPNIVEYIGSFKTRSHLYIIMVRICAQSGVKISISFAVRTSMSPSRRRGVHLKYPRV